MSRPKKIPENPSKNADTKLHNPRYKVKVAADNLWALIELARKAGYSDTDLGEDLSWPGLSLANIGGKFGRVQLDRCGERKMAEHLKTAKSKMIVPTPVIYDETAGGHEEEWA